MLFYPVKQCNYFACPVFSLDIQSHECTRDTMLAFQSRSQPAVVTGMGTILNLTSTLSGCGNNMAAWRQAISKNLREIRIHLCQTSESSNGVRYVQRIRLELIAFLAVY